MVQAIKAKIPVPDTDNLMIQTPLPINLRKLNLEQFMFHLTL